LGFETTIWGLGHENFGEQLDFNSYDIIFNLENYGDQWLPDLANVNGPFKILWSIDAHVRGEQAYENIFHQGKYSLLLHSTLDFVRKDYHLWFPNAIDDSLIKPLDVPKEHHLGFCGNYVNRKQILEYLTKKYGLKQDIFVIGHDMVRAVNSYRVHFNLNVANDINYRSFETIACRTLLLTNYNHQYGKLGFQDGVNCLMYSNIGELEAKIVYTFNNPAHVQTLSEQGYILSKDHTYDVRIRELIRQLEKLC
jgi:hypothetical protein